MYFREVSFFSAASQCSLYFDGVSKLRYLTANDCDGRPHGLKAPDIPTGLCATLTLPFLCSLLHMHGWVDGCILAEKLLHQTLTLTLTQPQTLSSPVQRTQPSSTQDSFAKSNGPALLLHPSFSLSASSVLAGLEPTVLTASMKLRWSMVTRLSEALQIDGGFTLGNLGWRDVSL